MSTNKIVLAYSGGLDTSFCVPYLIENGYEVHAVNIDSGGFSARELQEMQQRAMQLGAASFHSIKIDQLYYQKCIKYMIYGNVLRNNCYPLSVSSERPFQALALLDYCNEHDIRAVAHGSTGAGNDQVRFDLIFKALAPDIKIVTPIRDNALSRQEEMDFLAARGFSWDQVKKDYSINIGIWGTSVGGKETLTSKYALPDDAYPSQPENTQSMQIQLDFKQGELIGLNGESANSLQLIKELTIIANQYAIGRDTHVGDTIIGIKGRVGFEAGAAMILIKAHELLEKHTLTKWQMHWKKQLADWYGMLLHEGQYIEPVMRNIEEFLSSTQQNVTGKVFIKLHPFRFELQGIESSHDLMVADMGSYGEVNKAWSGEDAKGFIQILSNAPRAYYSVNQNEIPCIK